MLSDHKKKLGHIPPFVGLDYFSGRGGDHYHDFPLIFHQPCAKIWVVLARGHKSVHSVLKDALVDYVRLMRRSGYLPEENKSDGI